MDTKEKMDTTQMDTTQMDGTQREDQLREIAGKADEKALTTREIVFLGTGLQEMQELIQGLRQDLNLVMQGQRQGGQVPQPPGFQIQGVPGQGVPFQQAMT